MKPLNGLIVEDDPMVEFIHRNYLEKIGTFQEIYSADTVADAEHLLQSKQVDLVLLDVHLKNGNGLDLLKEIRESQQAIEVILITAANETQTIQYGLHLGVLDYLVKPFTYERFRQSIELFLKRQEALEQDNLAQETIDQMLVAKQRPDSSSVELDKGLSADTMDRIKAAIQTFPAAFTIQDLVEISGFSHVSVRKYMSYLETHDYVKSQIIYTKIGRPYKVYQKC
ncbi:response regulator [Enterococcus sp.]|jgi:two-component system CitB family response regulator|uniref:response regulator n=1 Tax=Enterococcus sp. TaxID=35783 RepID=UPI0025C28ACE|nr:response regulator [Enterococcus sp.]